MDEKKIVTWEMFKKYHEQLVGYIGEADDLVIEDLVAEEETEKISEDRDK